MPLDDLDLEFEDEEETKKKKVEAIHTDVDLEFQAPQGVERAKPQVVSKAASPGTAPSIKRPETSPGVVRKLDDVRPQGKVAAPQATPQSRVVGSSALKEESQYDLESEEVVRLREHARKVEFDAEVKVQVAEFKTEILGELLGDIKLMDHQIGQLLARINAKHPDMKQEVLMIKKILADFSAKKRK